MSLLDTASLLLTPNAYKESKLYSVIPSDGSGDFTFTRATTATRVNSNGLVELVPYNLLSWSEDFSNVYWSKGGGSSVTANTTTAPNGTLTADTLIMPNGSNVAASLANTINTTRTISFYLRADSNITIKIGLYSPTLLTSVNLTTSWQRFTFTHTWSGTFYPQIYNDSGLSVTIYAWGAMANEGSAALPYQKTETRLNIPRLDYSNGTCPSILLEPQRTNLLQQSSSFDNVYWAKTNGVLTANNTTAPDGTLTADLFTETTFTNSSASVGNSSLISVTSGVAYTTTIYAKKGNDKYLYLSNYYNSVNKYYTLIVDLESGTITKEQAGSSITSFSSSITSVGDGWYRISLTQTTASTQLYFILRISNSATPTIDASYGFITIPSNNNRSLYLWGAQLEAGSYATSYIPTTTASVTRNADVLSKTGISSLIGQTEGAVYFELTCDFQNSLGSIPLFLRGGSGSYNTSTYIQFGANIIQLIVYSGGVLQTVLASSTLTQGQKIKVAFAYKLNDFVLYIDGVQQAFSNSGTLSVGMYGIDLGTYALGSTQFQYNGLISSTALWKTRLTNDQLAQLTTI